MSWIEKRSPEEHMLFVTEVSDRICKIYPTDVAQELNALIQQKRYRDVVEFKFDYARLSYPEAIGGRQIQALVAKQRLVSFGYDPRQAARQTYYAMEEKCRKTNEFWDARTPKGVARAIFHRAREKILQILGPVPSLDQLDFSFGPGASTSTKSAVACFRSKLSARLECSIEMSLVLEEFLAEFPLWSLHHESEGSVEVGIVPGKLQFVPKNSKTDRPIVVEPLLNGLAQKGIGTHLKARFLKFGIDLSDQTRNRHMAFRGSVDGSLATIDLSSASDTIAIAVVFDLLPEPWADFLSSYRTGEVSDEGSVQSIEKFSSMGNGFTFELESLIFYSLAYAVTDYCRLDTRDVSIFGDDIIVPAKAYDLLKVILEMAGFLVNHEKSYHEGPFRESCGADFLRGMDIRPFYLKEQISDQYLFVFHNWCIRNCERELAEAVLQWIKPHNRIYGPDGFGDGHLIGSYRLRQNRKLKRDGWCGGYFDTFSLKPRLYKKPLPGDFLVPVYSSYIRASQESICDPFLVRGNNGYCRLSIYTLATSIFRRA